MSDQFNNGLQARQRLAAPVLRDIREKPVLNFIPFACARRKVCDCDAHSSFVRELLQRDLPQAATRTVAATAVGSDQQFPGMRETAASHPFPPAANRVDGKLRRVMIDADAHPTLIVEDIVNAVRNGLAEKRVFEVMHADLFGLPVRTPIPTAILEIPDQFLLFRIHRDRRLAAFQESRHLGIEVLELRVAVGMRGAFRVLRLACKL